MHSQLGLKLRLALARIEAEVVAILAPARHVDEFDKARKMRSTRALQRSSPTSHSHHNHGR